MSKSLLILALLIIFTTACSNSGSAVDNVLGSHKEDEEVGNPAISFTPSPYSFGLLQANSGSANYTITIKNESKKNVYLSSMSGANLNFSIVSTTCELNGNALNSGASCSVVVNFSPKVSGLLSMGLNFLYGVSPGETNLTASGSLTGTGVTPLVFGGIDSIDQVKCSSMRANWTNVAGASNYLVFSGTNLLATALAGSSDTVVTGLAPGTSYTLRVQATDALGIITSTTAQQTTTLSPAPLLMTQANLNFPSNYLTQNSPMTTINYNNLNTANDANMSYTCYYDRLPDGAVAATDLCTSLPGTVTFNTATGVLDWTPDDQAIGPYEIKVTAQLFSECSVNNIFVADVRGNFSTTNLVAEWDASFSDLTKPYVTVPLAGNTWKNLTAIGASLDGTLSSSTWSSKWQGVGTTANPYRLGFTTADQDYVSFGTDLNAYADMTIGAWVRTSAPAATSKVIFGNGGGGASGFAVRQSADAGKLEFVVGNVDGVTGYQTILSGLNPVAYWKLDEAAGVAIDDAIGTADGTASAGVTVNQAGAVATSNVSAAFSGTNSHINVPDTASLNITTGGLSITAWVYPTATPADYQGIIGKGNGSGGVYSYLLALDTGTLFPSLYMSGANDGTWARRATTALTLNTWNHVVATYNPAGPELIYYVNGVQAGVYPVVGGNLQISAERLEIGTMINNGYPFAGKLDEVAVFNSVLTPTDVNALYSSFVSCRSSSALAASVWNFVATTFNSATNNAKLYVNGVQQCSVNFPTGITGSAAPFVMGAKADGTSAWTGEIAHLAVYSTADVTKATGMYNSTAVRFFDWPTPIPTNLVFHLNASRGTGVAFPGVGCAATTWTDLSSNGYTGTLTNFGACAGSLGWQGVGNPTDPYHMDFLNGGAPANVVNFPHHANLSIANAITIFAIVKLNAYQANYRAILGKGNNAPNYGYLLTFPVNERKLSFYSSNNVGGDLHAMWNETATTALSVGTWSMVAMTWDSVSNTLKYYTHGVPDGSFPTTPGRTIGVNARPLEVGAMIDAQYPFDGSIMTVLVYDRALTAPEIQQNCQKYQPFVSGLNCN